MTGRSDQEMRALVRRGVERMRARRGLEKTVAGLRERDAEAAARGLIVWSVRQRDRMRRELRERFGFTVTQGEGGYVCRFEEPQHRPKTPQQAALWTDLFVHAIALEGTLLTMRAAVADFPHPDRARMVVNAFLDAMREAPAVYGAVAEAGFEPAIREYAAAMLAAWTRSHLHKGFNSRIREALGSEDWEPELVSAVHRAWAERDLDAPMKKSTLFRDTLPRQKDGRRQKAPGTDFVNLVSALLEGREVALEAPDEEPEEIALARFVDREKMLREAREAGLTPRELEIHAFYLQHPTATKRQAADHFGVSVETIKKQRRSIRKALHAA